MNKKISSEFAIVIILLVSTIFGLLIYFNGKGEEIDSMGVQLVVSGKKLGIKEKTKGYYDNFRKKCLNSKCCLDSIDNAEKHNSLLYESDKIENIDCPDGYYPNMLKCSDSYKWCSPKIANDIDEISDSIKNKCKKMTCMPDCLDGWSETCFYDGNKNNESDFKLGFKVEPKDLCFGINFISVCGKCENKFEIKEIDQFIEVSCEEFYQKIENKNTECKNCLKEVMTAS